MKTVKSNLLQEVISFIRAKYGLFDDEIVNENTRLEDDLGIMGDEVYDFFVAYGKEFNVDVSNFMAADYFSGEGWSFLSKKKRERKPFTIGELIKGIIAGRLDENVISGENVI